MDKDPIATAEVLLGCRDQLIEAGWKAEPLESPRLAALAEIEGRAPGVLSPGWADRLRVVVETLAERAPQFAKTVVLEHPEHLPKLWRLLFERLGRRFDLVDPRLAAGCAKKNSDLGRLQRAPLDLARTEVCLKAKRSATGRVALQFLDLTSGVNTKLDGRPKRMKNEALSNAIAAGIHQLLDPNFDCRIADRQLPDPLRPVRPGDLAVLCRSNENVAAMAQNLADLGYTVSVAGPGLFATPECQLAMACLRRLADPTDSLATATILAMCSEVSTGELVADRIQYMASIRANSRTGRRKHPAASVGNHVCLV